MNSKDRAEQQNKESKINELVRILHAHGFVIRREKLRSGHGWKTVSGTCRMSDKQMLFVDRKLPLDEQLLFLSGVVRELGLEPSAAHTPEPHAGGIQSPAA